jgi:hypothetical protein
MESMMPPGPGRTGTEATRVLARPLLTGFYPQEETVFGVGELSGLPP